MSRLIAVIGSTGMQGGSVCRVLLETGQWKVRAVTRNPSSDAAVALVSAGAEVVVADMDDESSLVRAFEGVHAIFAVTNFWEHLFSGLSQTSSGERESKQAMNLARAAAKTVTLEHYIWSTLASASKLTDGQFPCPHWDYKAEVDERIKVELPHLASKTTYLVLTFYSSNLAYFPFTKPLVTQSHGKALWLLPCRPSTPLPVTGDMSLNPGIFVRQILAHPQTTHTKYLSVTTETLTMEQMLKIWSEVTGKEAIFIEITAKAFEDMWGLAGAELATQFKCNEVLTDWDAHRKKEGTFVTKEEIGIKSEELIGMRETLVSLKGLLL